ncbi:MAG: hypothetical protein V1882_05130 [Candidatus Omnitrophota bacterium]
MIQFQRNKSFYFTAILLLAGFVALTFHPLIHAIHHDGDKDDADSCPLCRFVAALGFVLFCVFSFFLKARQVRFDLSEFRQCLPFEFLSPRYGRAPPVLS